MMAERDHSQRNWAARATSGLPPLATELRTSQVIRFVPNPEVAFSAERHSEHELGSDGAEVAVSIGSIELKQPPTPHDTQ
jgi:hypothetical protein